MAFSIKADLDKQAVEEILRRMRQFDRTVRGQMLRKMLRRGGAIIAKDAKRRVPVRTGWLKRSIEAKVKITRRTGSGYCVVAPARDKVTMSIDGMRRQVRTKFGVRMKKAGADKINPSNYAHLVENGRAAVLPKTAKKLAIPLTRTGKFTLVDSARPAAPKPFLRPAADNNRSAIVRAFKESFQEEVTKQLVKSVSKSIGLK